MTFDEVGVDDDMAEVAVRVGDEMRDKVRELYAAMCQRNRELYEENDRGMANVVLAGLTLVWLELVHNTMGTGHSESAITLLLNLRPQDRGVARDMKMAARDFLRRSRWLPKRRVR
jgi:hypothetical protein